MNSMSAEVAHIYFSDNAIRQNRKIKEKWIERDYDLTILFC